MRSTRRNEWNFAANMAALISEVLREPNYSTSPLGQAEPELTELRGAKRLDLAIFAREDPNRPLITAELKLPWRAEGRTPYNSQLVSDAHDKASKAGALYFITWNVRRLVVWKTDDPGVELESRVLYDRELLASAIRSEIDLDKPDVRSALNKSVRELIHFLDSLLVGPAEPSFLPLDRLFIAKLEAALYFPIEATARQIGTRVSSQSRFRHHLERWMREEQGWVVSKAAEEQNFERAARFSCYVLVNRLCFYNALRRKYKKLPRLVVANSISTGAMLRKKLSQAFLEAKRFTGNYETVFDGDFGDDLPFASDEAVGDWRKLIRHLDHYDFANMSVDIIGAMYEQLIQPEERHRYGQHYTQPAVVDLINSFAIGNAQDCILDPACGGGTFLVRAYARKRHLDPELDHSELLKNIYGCDILNYACHLSTINLAVRDLIDDDNFPRIHHGDYLRYKPNQIFSEHPERLQAGGLVLGKHPIRVQAAQFDAIVGNPPYINARDLPAGERDLYVRTAIQEWPQYPWRGRSDIYLYFWTHSPQFLKEGGCLALLTQAAWLDTEYGFPLQAWMLDNFRIEAIMESESEPWFTDARVATVITILNEEKDPTRRDKNLVRFVQFRSRLRDLLGDVDQEAARQSSVERLRNKIREASNDFDDPAYRIRVVRQGSLAKMGTDSEGRYRGSKWGRYLRSIDNIYELQQRFSRQFVNLETLAQVRRGVTTNCDDFFIVSDITKEALERVSISEGFREKFRVSRGDVTNGSVAIIRRSDGLETALERSYLRPILKSGRNVEWISTKLVGAEEYAVVFRSPRTHLSRLARLYIDAGEREGWQKAPSFANLQVTGDQWYILQQQETAPILFIKTMQYTPLVLFNDGELLANQRLYGIVPHPTLDAASLCAVLNSTVMAAERYATVKALGREAAIDLEVFAAALLRTPNLASMKTVTVDKLRAALSVLSQRRIEPMLEDVLQEGGLLEARSYIAKQAVCEAVWPAELRDEARQEIDKLILGWLGVPSRALGSSVRSLYNQLLEHTRQLRLLELEAQKNRRGGGSGSPTARELADEVWAQLLEGGRVEMRSIPEDFLESSMHREIFRVPAAHRFVIPEPSLFDSRPRFVMRAGKEEVEVHNRAQLEYIRFLADRGITGDVAVPVRDQDCIETLAKIEAYWTAVSGEIVSAATDVTGNHDLQTKIVREALRRLISSHRGPELSGLVS